MSALRAFSHGLAALAAEWHARVADILAALGPGGFCSRGGRLLRHDHTPVRLMRKAGLRPNLP